MSRKVKITHGSGNVFADIVLPCPDLHLKIANLRSELAEANRKVKWMNDDKCVPCDQSARIRELTAALTECAVPLEALHSVEQWKPMLSNDMRAQIAVAIGKIRGALAMKEQG